FGIFIPTGPSAYIVGSECMYPRDAIKFLRTKALPFAHQSKFITDLFQHGHHRTGNIHHERDVRVQGGHYWHDVSSLAEPDNTDRSVINVWGGTQEGNGSQCVCRQIMERGRSPVAPGGAA